MKSSSPYKRRLLLLLAVAGLTACTPVKTISPSYYVLNPQDELTALQSVSKDSLSIEVVSLEIPPYLDRKQIVTRSSNQQLDFSDSHRWGGKLRKNLERVLVRNLSLLVNSNNVWVRPKALAAKPDYKVQLDILHFEFNGQQVRLSAQWQVKNTHSDKIIAADIAEISTSTESMAPADLYPAIVSAMNESLARLSTGIASKILADATG